MNKQIPINKENFLADYRAQEQKDRDLHAGKGSTAVYLPFEDAKQQTPEIDWAAAGFATPESIGQKIWDPVPLADIVEVFDWSPFFHAWELRGVYPKILTHEGHGEEATKLFNESAKYFNVGKIERDRLETYAEQKDMTLEMAEKWLASNLAD